MLSAKNHWIALRAAAVVLIPLCIWLVYSIVHLAGADYATFTAWLQQPLNAILLIVFIAVSFYHASLGVHEILEDYVHNKNVLCASMIAKKAFFILVGALCIYAVASVNLKPTSNPQPEMRTGVPKSLDGRKFNE